MIKIKTMLSNLNVYYFVSTTSEICKFFCISLCCSFYRNLTFYNTVSCATTFITVLITIRVATGITYLSKYA